MSEILEITQLSNGDIVLRDPEARDEPIVSIRFSSEVRDMLGPDMVGIAEAMIEAATDYMGAEVEVEGDVPETIH
jgi:hypothetical protein